MYQNQELDFFWGIGENHTHAKYWSDVAAAGNAPAWCVMPQKSSLLTVSAGKDL